MKQAVAIIAVIVLVAIGWLVFGGKDKNQQSDNQAANQTGSQSQASSNGTSQVAKLVATDKVSIADMAFSPADITVKAGTTVTWTNNDSVAHTVTENDGKDGPGSSPISPGKSYNFTFKKAGIYDYICSIHTEMTGSVTVTE